MQIPVALPGFLKLLFAQLCGALQVRNSKAHGANRTINNRRSQRKVTSPKCLLYPPVVRGRLFLEEATRFKGNSPLPINFIDVAIYYGLNLSRVVGCFAVLT